MNENIIISLADRPDLQEQVTNNIENEADFIARRNHILDRDIANEKQNKRDRGLFNKMYIVANISQSLLFIIIAIAFYFKS